MATLYIAYHQYPTKVVGLTTMQTEGPLIASEIVDLSAPNTSKEAPEGTQYATIWSDVPFYYNPNGAAAKGPSSKPWPANLPVQIPGIKPLVTKIGGIAI